MNHTWALQDAKNKFSELVETTLRDGPQVVTRRGKEAVVVMPAGAYRALTKPRGSLVAFFAKSPLKGVTLDVARSRDTGREVSL
jgi:prevent-host-death family protein